jgi:transposase-like protein
MVTRKCPVCKSENIILDTAAHTGKYKCQDCNYIGVLILEMNE